MNELANTEFNSNLEYTYTINDLNNFSNITKPVRLFNVLYPKGLYFKFNKTFYKFNFFKNHFIKSKKIPYHYFEMPVKIFCEASKNFNFTDTGTSFVLKIFIKHKFNIYQAYLLFIFLTYSEKGYFSNLKMFLNKLFLLKKNFFPKEIT